MFDMLMDVALKTASLHNHYLNFQELVQDVVKPLTLNLLLNYLVIE